MRHFWRSKGDNMGKYNRMFETDEWGTSNPYYDPEQCGLKLIHVLDVPNLSYEYSTIIVVQDVASGAVFMAYDSGCSCPTPFEGVRGLGDMRRIKTIEQYDRFVDEHRSSYDAFPLSDIRKARTKLKRLGLTTAAERKTAREKLEI